MHTHAHAKQLHSLPVFDAYHAHDGMKACATATMAPPHAHIVEHISTSRWCRSWGSRTHACTHTTHTHTHTHTRACTHTAERISASYEFLVQELGIQPPLLRALLRRCPALLMQPTATVGPRLHGAHKGEQAACVGLRSKQALRRTH